MQQTAVSTGHGPGSMGTRDGLASIMSEPGVEHRVERGWQRGFSKAPMPSPSTGPVVSQCCPHPPP